MSKNDPRSLFTEFLWGSLFFFTPAFSTDVQIKAFEPLLSRCLALTLRIQLTRVYRFQGTPRGGVQETDSCQEGSPVPDGHPHLPLQPLQQGITPPPGYPVMFVSTEEIMYTGSQ